MNHSKGKKESESGGFYSNALIIQVFCRFMPAQKLRLLCKSNIGNIVRTGRRKGFIFSNRPPSGKLQII